MSGWEKKTTKLKPDHTWQAQPGYKIFVMDRGAVRFLVPEAWIIEPDKHSIRFFDGAPPNDDCRLECSYLRIPLMDWSGLPVSDLIAAAMKGDSRNMIRCGETVRADRQDIEIAWAEFAFTDPNEHRAARTRVCIARGGGIQCLVTFDFWSEDAARLAPAWHQVIHTLELGKYVSDSTTGD